MSVTHPWLGRLCPLVILCTVSARAAPPTKLECVAAHEQSQVSRRAGKLIDAKRSLLICAQSACPEAAQEPCQRWLREVEASIPTVVVAARDRDGKPVLDVRISVDDRVLAERLDGRALAVDAGTHRFVFEHADEKPRQIEITLLEGEKNRRVEVSFATTASPAPPPDTDPRPDQARPIPVGTYIFAGLGVVALGTFGVFAWRGLDQENSLRDRGCAPSCPKGDVDRVRQSYLIGDIALGVSVVSLGVATFLFFDSRVSAGKDHASASIGGRF